MQLDTLTDEELAILRQQVEAEVDRRATLAQAESTIDHTNTVVLESEGITSGDEWRQPTSAVDAYPRGFEVVHDGKTWVSLIPGNAHAPGVSGWREKVADASWVQPTGAHDSYPVGARVTYQGGVWISILPANVWAPGVAGWQRIL